MTEKYRTKAEAYKDGTLTPCPDKLAISTLYQYEYSISWHHEGKAYMEHLMISTDGLRFENGEMFFEGALEPISTVELQDMRTNEGIEEIDIPLLTMYYSVILTKYQERLKKGESIGDITSQITTVYAPDLARAIGIIPTGEDGGLHRADIVKIMDKMRKFHNIIGIMHVVRNGRPDKSYFPVLNFEGYDSKKNTISFFSPYLIYVVKEIFAESTQRDKKGNIKLKRNGFPILKANHSFLVKASITTERNKAAVENVFIIVQLIEQAGDNIPHIKASTLIERNKVLTLRLNESSNPIQLLSRVFKKTWELLRSQTTLLEIYDSIVLPDPNDITKIPTPSNMNKLVFEFPHNGKIKKKT